MDAPSEELRELELVVGEITASKQTFETFKYDEVAEWQQKVLGAARKMDAKDHTDAEDFKNALADVERLEAENLLLKQRITELESGQPQPAPPPPTTDYAPVLPPAEGDGSDGA